MVRCDHCRLVQFRTSNARCRRCYHPFEVEVVAPPPVVEAEAHPNIAAGVRSWRRLRGLTQKQLACAAHLPRTYISRIENGRILPGLGTLERVAIALHVNLPALLDRQRLGRGSDGAALLAATEFGNGHSNGHANGNGHNGHANGNGNGHSNGHGNGHGNGYTNGYPVTDSDGAFLRQMLRYSGLLTSSQRQVVLARVRQLATAHS